VTSKRRRFSRSFALALLVGGVLTACVPPANDPENYAEPVVNTTLEHDGTTISTEVSQAQANFLQGCLRWASPSECECIFGFFVENVPFEEFKDLDAQVADQPESFPQDIQNGIRRCQGGRVGPAGPVGEPSGASDPTSAPGAPGEQ
jgi:hypothetical protein